MKFLKKLFKSETIFYLAVFLLPFENFAFAPSVGWAAISPLLFTVYLILNLNRIWDALKTFKKIVWFFAIGIIIGLVMAYINHANFANIIPSIYPIGLGGIQLLTFYIFYKKNKDLSAVISTMVIAYAICIMVGFFQFIAVQTGNKAIIDFFDLICKRSYLGQDRVQFFFTEPSFIGMHLFGVLLPLYLVSKRKDLLFTILAFTFAAFIFGSGMRVIIDVFVVGAILGIYLIIKHKQYKIIPLIIVTGVVAFFTLYNTNDRFRAIANDGIYSDGSLATRYFRLQGTVIGYGKTFPSVITGYGLGNSMEPLRAGYDIAENSYTNSYVKEVEELGDINYHQDDISFSLEIRMINEFGVIMFIIALIYMIRLTKASDFEYKWPYFAIIAYSYLQFESYAFYALWLFIVIMYFTRKLPKHAHKSGQPTRVLVFGINDNPGGTESVIMNYYRNLDPSKVILDFLCNTETVAYEDEIKALGGKIYRITARSKNRKKYFKELYEFFKNHASEYDVIWENVSSLANIDYLIYAEKYGIPRRIIHAHNDRNMDSKLRGILHKINRHQIQCYATDFWTCSAAAGYFFYCKPQRKSANYRIIHDALDLEKYAFDESARKKIRRELNISDKKVLLNVGRLHFQKNQLFLLDVFKELVKADDSYYLLLIGDGEDRAKIEQKIKKLHLEKSVSLLGLRDDVAKMYSAADIVMFPSLFEGLGMVILEGEASGAPVILSKEISIPQNLLTTYSTRVSLDASISSWVSAIEEAVEAVKTVENRKSYSDEAIKHLTHVGYEIGEETTRLEANFQRKAHR